MPTAALPVGEALYTILQDSALQTATPGGWHDDPPQGGEFPYGWYELSERDLRGMGTGGLPEVELRTHVFSRYGGMREAQRFNQMVVDLLKDVALTVAGYTMCGKVFYDETIVLRDEEVAGVKVHEVVSLFRIYVEQ